MADEVVPVAPVAAPIAEAAPVAAPAVVAEAPAVVEAPPAAEPAPAEVPSLIEGMGDQPKVEEAPKTEEAPKEGDQPPAAEPTKEADAEPKKDDQPKPADAPKEGEPKVDAAPVEPAKPEPVEYAYQVPEVITMDDAQKGEFHGILDEFRANPKEGAQKLLDLHAKSLQSYHEETLRNQIKTFNATRREWQIAADSDPEIGGPAKDTARAAIARVRDAVISTAKPGTPQYAADKTAFDQFCRVTGAGDNPVMLKMFHRMARFLDEPTPPPPGGKPPASNGANPNRSRSERMYPNTDFGRKAQ